MNSSAQKKVLNIIGCGKVGKALGRCWASSGTVEIGDVLNQSVSSAQEAVSFIGAGRAANSFDALAPADFYMIGAGDDQLAIVCDGLVRSGRMQENSVVFHCSGALDSAVLQSARKRRAAVASIHPIRSFAVPENVAADFAGTYCGIEGDDAALKALVPVFATIGGKPVVIDTSNKRIYHAAAVFASNYLVTLVDVSCKAYLKAGIPPELALQLLGPLVRHTVDNVLHLGPKDALTGPIARGDMDAALAQLQAVDRWEGKYGNLYRQFARLTAELAGQPHQQFMMPEEKEEEKKD